MSKHIPSELLNLVFLEIYNDRFLLYNLKIHYLYNCLLVNRFWCKNVVSLLWSLVFAFSLKKKSSKTRAVIIDTCLKFINKEQQTDLLKSGIHVDVAPSLFKYPSFIKDIKFEALLLNVRDWIFLRHPSEVDRNLILRILLEVLAEYGSNLDCFVSDHLSLDLSSIAIRERLPLNELTILGNKNIKNIFSHVNELWIGGRSLENPFISVITNICHNVVRNYDHIV
ncbi:13257_t:CDS:2 [Dentiscutata heterogama]|uniref:13257_t:CDS:1 n=1 Tax=Dentiscutata heterogama TaxID=1316150 RepID=A0ACA9KDA3_9GLOM|nr:13257_t:CDS:2 [Dentiscutata heterogama]